MSKAPLQTLVVSVLLFLFAPLPVQAQSADKAPTPEFETLDDLLNFLDSWQGSPEELSEVYDKLPPESRAFVDSNFEFWSIEGGISLLGGASIQSEAAFAHRVSVSLGAVWPFGEYPLPVYYALPDIPGPWALGFQVFAGVEGFDSFVGGASLRYAHEYIGSTPYLELGPMVKVDGDGAHPGAHLDLGYGSILYQGYLQGSVTQAEDPVVSIMLGARLPWLVFEAL